MLLAERNEMLWRAVDRLPERQRQLILALSVTPSPSYKDVARALSMPIGSIGPVRGRALRTLRHLLAESEEAEAPVDLTTARSSRRVSSGDTLVAG